VILFSHTDIERIAMRYFTKLERMRVSLLRIAELMRELAVELRRIVHDFHQPVRYGPNVVPFRRQDRLVRAAVRV
jgi:hypothetical protein